MLGTGQVSGQSANVFHYIRYYVREYVGRVFHLDLLSVHYSTWFRIVLHIVQYLDYDFVTYSAVPGAGSGIIQYSSWIRIL